MYKKFEAHNGTAKLDYQLGFRHEGSIHPPKEAKEVFGSIAEVYQSAVFLMAMGKKLQIDELSFGCTSKQAAQDFQNDDSPLRLYIGRLVSRDLPHGMIGHHVAAIQHTLENEGLDSHIDNIRFNLLTNKCDSIFTTTDSDLFIRRNLASALSSELGYPSPDDSYRLEEHIPEDSDPQMRGYKQAVDNIICQKIRDRELTSFGGMLSFISEAWNIYPRRLRSTNGQGCGIMISSPIYGKPITLKSRKYANSIEFDSVLKKLEIIPQNRELKTKNEVPLSKIEDDFKFRNVEYLEELSNPPHSHFEEPMSVQCWEDIRSILPSISKSKLHVTESPQDFLRNDGVSITTLKKSYNYGKQTYEQESVVPLMLIGRRKELQAAYEHFKQQQRRLELLANFARNSEPASNKYGESGFSTGIPFRIAGSPRALALRSKQAEQPVEFPQPEPLINSDDDNSVEMEI